MTTSSRGSRTQWVSHVRPEATTGAWLAEEDSAAGVRRVSVVIPNYNYASFVGQAVESALAVRWPDVEVIVVDDASTDSSWERLQVYRERVTLIRLESNSGPRVACNVGFGRSTGDVVIFLDSDDRLHPSVAMEIAGRWRTGISKMQMQMRRIDRYGRPIGRVFPRFATAPTPAEIRKWMLLTGAYPTPPGSGNAYSRHFLRQLFPLDDRCGDATDSACLAAAPFLGDVVTIVRPLVDYREHGANRSSIVADPARLRTQIERAHSRQVFALQLAATQWAAENDTRSPVSPLSSLRRGRHLLQMRVAECRVGTGDPPLPHDRRRRILLDTVLSPFAPGPENLIHRIAVTIWCTTTLFAPASIARRLVLWRFR